MSVSEATPHAAARNRRLLIGIIGSIGARGLTLLTPLLLLPVMLDELGPDLFGLWSIATSMTAMVAFADLGLGNGILTLLPKALAQGDRGTARRLVSTGYALLAAVGAFLVIVVSLVAAFNGWGRIAQSAFGSTSAPATADSLALLVLGGFALTLPLGFVQRLQYAIQEAWASSIWQVLGAAATLATVLVAVAFNAEAMTIVALSALSPPLVMLANSVVFFSRHKSLRPRLAEVSRETTAAMLRLGAAFLSLSVVTSLALNVDNLLVGASAGLEDVAQYSIAVRLFSVLSLAVTFVALPLWPAIADALARSETLWVRRTTIRMSLASAGAVVAIGTLLVVFRDEIMSIWMSGTIHIPLNLALALTTWSALVAAMSPVFSVQNAKGIVKPQLIGWSLFLGASVPLKMIGLATFGTSAVPAAGAVAYVVILVPAALLGYRVALRQAHLRSQEG